MTSQVNVQEAKTRLSQLLAQAEAGEEVVIARDGKPIVRLVPVTAAPPRPVGFVQGWARSVTPSSNRYSVPEDELERWV